MCVLTIFTKMGKLLSKLVRKEMCQRHAAFCLVRGVTKHDTLVTSTYVHIIFANMYPTSNVWCLLIDTH